MTKTDEMERRLQVLEGSEKLDQKFGWSTFWVLAIPGVIIPVLLIALGWGASN